MSTSKTPNPTKGLTDCILLSIPFLENKTISKKVKSVKNNFVLSGLPQDVMNLIKSYLNINDFKTMAQVSKTDQKMSGQDMVDRINKNTKPIKDLGFTFTQLKAFLQKYGSLLEYLDFTDFIVPKDLQQNPLIDLIAYCPNLKHLSLKNRNFNRKDIEFITTSETLKNLTSLDLYQNNLGSEGAQAIAASTTLINLTILDAGSNFITTDGAKAIATSETLKALRILRFRNNFIHNEGGRAFAESKTLKNLWTLDLYRNTLGDDAAIAFAASETLTNLGTLNLGDNFLSDEGATAIAASKTLKNLKYFIR